MELRRPSTHDKLVMRLWSAAREERLPHAFFFEGPEGVGKFLAAAWFAAGLLCADGPGEPCGTCGPCKRVKSGNHPDILTIDPVLEGEERIKIDRIALRSDSDVEQERCLESFLDLRAMEGERRCVLIRECHRMTEQAQNALLKTLEEPRPGVVILLETHRGSRLLTTILSRCVRVRFGHLAADVAAAILDEAGVPAAEAASLARWTGGSPGRSLSWRKRGAGEFLTLLGECLAGQRSAQSVAAAFWEVEGSFSGATESAKGRDRARFVLDLALAVARDGGQLRAGIPAEELPHGEAAQALAELGPQSLRRLIDRLLLCRSDIDRNLAPEAVLERALLVLADPGRIVGARAGV